MRFDGKVAIVTGGASGIGRATAARFAAEGATVIVGDIDETGGAALADASDGRIRFLRTDVSQEDDIRALIEAARAAGGPDILFNNAGAGGLRAKIDEIDAAGWDRHMAVNARAPALLTRAFADAVPDGAGALVVNLLDAKLVQPNPDFFTYTVSKMALAGVMELTARLLAARGIRVCGIAPSVTLVSGPQSRANFDRVHKLNALGRGVEVEQLVQALRFLIASPTITGQTIVLDGGQRFLGLPRDVQFLD